MRYAITAMLALCATAAPAEMKIERTEFVFSKDLIEQGAAPFPVSGTGGAIFGLRRDKDLWLCFLADTEDAAAERQETLMAEIRGDSPDREVPNIPVACVLTQ